MIPHKSKAHKQVITKLKHQIKINEQWIKKNRHRCGHSLTEDSLGDEGWHELHSRDGEIAGLLFAIQLLRDLDKAEGRGE